MGAPATTVVVLLAVCAAASAQTPPPASTTTTAGCCPGDWGVINAMLFHGIVPEDFRAYFDRDPERTPPDVPRAVLAPADGVVLDLREGRDERSVVIALGLGDVHVQRAPLAGRVKRLRWVGKGHLSTSDPKHFANVARETTVESEAGTYVLTQITGLWTKRIEVFFKEGDELVYGARFGRIMLGSTVILTVPKSVTWTVGRFQRVQGGETVIGRY